MQQSKHMKQYFEKDGLKVDNRNDVDRKRVELRIKNKKWRERFNALSKNPAFIDYMYDLLAECEYFTPGAGRVSGECYEKKGKLMLANKIADDLTFLSDGGIEEINAIRKAIHKQGLIKQIDGNDKEGK